MRAVPLIVIFRMLASPASAEVVSAERERFRRPRDGADGRSADSAYAAFGGRPAGGTRNTPTAATPPTSAWRYERGGCFCERLKDGGGVEHMRVTFVDPGKRIVLTGVARSIALIRPRPASWTSSSSGSPAGRR